MSTEGNKPDVTTALAVEDALIQDAASAYYRHLARCRECQSATKLPELCVDGFELWKGYYGNP